MRLALPGNGHGTAAGAERFLQKQRDPRTSVMTPIRMRCGAHWSDVTVVNLSSRGLGLHGADPPGRGSYVELRRGSDLVIVGQVMWSRGGRFGLRTQDHIWVDGLLGGTANAQATPAEEWRERRARPRATHGSEWSRIRGRMLQHGFVAAASLCATIAAGFMIDSALAAPLHKLAVTLAPF